MIESILAGLLPAFITALIAMYYLYRLEAPKIPADHWTRKVGLCIGHRGARVEECPTGNTMSAFRYGAAHGAVGIEMDVRLTADKKVVVFHDPSTGNLLEGPNVSVGSITLKEIQSRKFRKEADRNEVVPQLEDVIHFGKQHGLKLIIEIKESLAPREAALAVIDILNQHTDYWDSITVISFDPFMLWHFRRANSKIPTVMLSRPELVTSLLKKRVPLVIHPILAILDRFAAFLTTTPELIPKFTGCNMLGPYFGMITEDLVANAKKNGLGMNSWTVNTVDEARRLTGLGVNFITTDKPGEVC